MPLALAAAGQHENQVDNFAARFSGKEQHVARSSYRPRYLWKLQPWVIHSTECVNSASASWSSGLLNPAIRPVEQDDTMGKRTSVDTRGYECWSSACHAFALTASA